MNESKLVYSTEKGRILAEIKEEIIPKSDEFVRIQRQTAGRKGKSVLVLSNFGLSKNELSKICSELKKKIGAGGAVKEYTIEVQSENKEQIKSLLEKRGFKVKFIGG